MKRHFACAMGFGLALGAAAHAQVSDGQPLQLASRAPAFYAIIGSHIERAEARNVAVLRERIALRLHEATIPEALDAIEAQTRLRFAFKPSILPSGATVSLDAREITVAAALTQILQDADVDVQIAPYGLASIVPRHASKASRDTATGTIVGRVTDSNSHAGVSYATVSLDATSRSVSANDSGVFRIARVPVGTYSMTARRVGYVIARRSVTVVSGEVITVDFALEPSAGQLNQIVVTGSLVPTETKSLPTPITVISDSQITQQQPRTVNELFRQSVPTAVAFDLFQNPNSTYLTVRGSTDLNVGGTQIKTFIDGVEVAQNSASPVDPASIDHIEVIRGPEAAAIYGSGAIDGVIQIFTKRGDDGHGSPSVDAQIAAADVQTPYAGFRGVLRQTYSGDIRGGTQDASYAVGGGYTQTNNWLPFGAYSAQSTPSVYGGIHYGRSIATLDLSARYHIVDAPSTNNPELRVTEPPGGSFSEPAFTSDRYTNTTVGASLGLQPLPSWRNSFTIGYDENNWNEVQRRPRLTSPADTELSYSYTNRNKISLRYTSAWTQQLGSEISGTFIVGTDYWAVANLATSSTGALNTFGQIITDPSIPFNNSTYPSHNTGVFAQTQIGFFDALFLTAGLRADWNSDFGDSIGAPISPRVGLAYSRTFGFTTIKLRSSWGSAILPPYAGSKEYIVSNGSVQLANPHLVPQRQYGGDGGFDVLFGRVGSIGATYFRQTAVDLNQQVQLPDSQPTYQTQTVGTVTNSGVEVESGVGVGPVSLRLMYGYTRSRVDHLAKGYSGDLQVGDQTLDVPRHNAGAMLSMHVWHGTSVAAGLTYVGPWTDYDQVKMNACFAYFFSGNNTHCPAAFLTAVANGQFNTRSFFMQYPTIVKANLSVTQTISPWMSAFLSVDNIGDNQNYEGNNSNARVGRISTIGLRLHH